MIYHIMSSTFSLLSHDPLHFILFVMLPVVIIMDRQTKAYTNTKIEIINSNQSLLFCCIYTHVMFRLLDLFIKGLPSSSSISISSISSISISISSRSGGSSGGGVWLRESGRMKIWYHIPIIIPSSFPFSGSKPLGGSESPYQVIVIINSFFSSSLFFVLRYYIICLIAICWEIFRISVKYTK